MMAREVSYGCALVVALGALGGGCTTHPDNGAGGGEADEQAILDAVARFESEGFVRISARAAASQHGAAPAVVVWVSEGSAAAYRAVATGSAPTFPEGTIVIKQNTDDAGTPDGSVTVMAKLEPGYAPESGDWWWGRFDTSAKLVEGGKIDFCIQCHEANGFPVHDWVGGVPSDNQTP